MRVRRPAAAPRAPTRSGATAGTPTTPRERARRWLVRRSYGGVQIGDTGYWVGDYTVEPENGGVGVFAHEFGHDLGLPDLYDTSGNTGGAENSTAFWTLYSSGSYGSTGQPKDGIGSKPIPMSAYEKIFLGWSDYQVVGYQQKASIKLGPSVATTKQAQQVVALLPDKVVETRSGAPYAGASQYFSGSGNDLDTTMTKHVALPAGTVSLSAKAKYDIEMDWDYGYLTVNGTPVRTNLSTASNPNGQNFGNGITGSSGGAWVDLTADLSAFAGPDGDARFPLLDRRRRRAGAAASSTTSPSTGQPVDGAETDTGWTLTGFTRAGSTVKQSFFNAYFAENRTYLGYDAGLRTSPYNFGFGDTKPNWVEHFPYQDGLLVWYYDTSFADNNVGDSCAGRTLRRALPARRRAPRPAAPSGQRSGVAAPDAVLRLDLRARADRPDLPAHLERGLAVLRQPAGQPALRRHDRATGSRRTRRSATRAGRASTSRRRARRSGS